MWNDHHQPHPPTTMIPKRSPIRSRSSYRDRLMVTVGDWSGSVPGYRRTQSPGRGAAARRRPASAARRPPGPTRSRASQIRVMRVQPAPRAARRDTAVAPAPPPRLRASRLRAYTLPAYTLRYSQRLVMPNDCNFKKCRLVYWLPGNFVIVIAPSIIKKW